MSYLNLYLIIKKEKPHITINNYIQGSEIKKTEQSHPTEYIKDYGSSTTEVPIESNFTVKDIDGEKNLSSEKLQSDDISSTVKKIKKIKRGSTNA